MSDSGDIELVYEPGFGSMGGLHENIMVENPTQVFALKPETKNQIQKIIEGHGFSGEVVELLTVVEPGSQERSAEKMVVALESAIMRLGITRTIPLAERVEVTRYSRLLMHQYSSIHFQYLNQKTRQN